MWLLRDGRDVTRLLSNVGHWGRAVVEALHPPLGDTVVAQLLRYVYEVTDGLEYQQFRETIHRQIPEAETFFADSMKRVLASPGTAFIVASSASADKVTRPVGS
jgi:hypothetical protein